MQLPTPFIRLPFRFDAEVLAAEALAVPGEQWRAHPSGMAGNDALPLIARNGESGDDFDGPMQTTRALECMPYTRQVMASFGEVLGRSRLMRLAPGCRVARHVDFNYHWRHHVRIHVPIITCPRVLFHCGHESRHLRAGDCWIFNSWLRHEVVNQGATWRIHLVVDVTGSSRFWRLVERCATRSDDSNMSAMPVIERRPGDAHLLTERFSTPGVMSPGELDGLIVELLDDLARHPGNDTALLAHYAQLLHDFRRDWRCHWLLHGTQPEGRDGYHALLQEVRSGLHPEPRALVTASNGIGANAVIAQRILAPALSRADGHPG
ncbi:MAG: aspartyl/asparaginyl beta-hydroxylase domain-containing protein [Pseudomonadales bacterium]|nr:aspartyl/asparaginyl beta-hydroxylase domain-containing protein [Pseudomonadales bacterium]